MKNFDHWTFVKKKTESSEKCAHFHEGEIFYARIGENVGFEQCGKGAEFLRPVLVVKKFNQRIFWGVPLSNTKKEGKFYQTLKFRGKTSTAILSQLKLVDSKRLIRKIGGIQPVELVTVKTRLRRLLK